MTTEMFWKTYLQSSSQSLELVLDKVSPNEQLAPTSLRCCIGEDTTARQLSKVYLKNGLDLQEAYGPQQAWWPNRVQLCDVMLQLASSTATSVHHVAWS